MIWLCGKVYVVLGGTEYELVVVAEKEGILVDCPLFQTDLVPIGSLDHRP